mgnify:CR=1 FL=1
MNDKLDLLFNNWYGLRIFIIVCQPYLGTLTNLSNKRKANG